MPAPTLLITQDSLPTTVVAGTKFRGAVAVNLTDDAPAVSVTLYASTSPTLADATPLQILVSRRKLKAGKSRTFRFSGATLSTSLPAGTYYLVAQASGAGGDSAPAASTATVTVAAPVVSLAATVDSVAPATVSPGRHATLEVTIANNGNIDSTGLMTINLGLVPAGSTEHANVATLNRNVRVKAGRSAVLNLHFTLPKSEPAGTYRAFVSIDQNGKATSAIGASVLTVEP